MLQFVHVFFKKDKNKFSIIAVYVDDLCIIENLDEVDNTIAYSKNEFKRKDLDRTKFCTGLQIEHLSNGTFIHQSLNPEKI